mmetsp:Transcript_36474/g.91434  ORF Transcript_36474/g.91434 Transcript_36474/m.91434 type:complete len:97 (-) Transcript_36474:101-391(-)
MPSLCTARGGVVEETLFITRSHLYLASYNKPGPLVMRSNHTLMAGVHDITIAGFTFVNDVDSPVWRVEYVAEYHKFWNYLYKAGVADGGSFFLRID